jgi:photosystem II stability/assembly factor-like uncharacterized protein
MCKIAVVVAVALSLAGASHADDQWVQVPTARHMLNNKQDALAFANEKTGWYGNGTGAVYGTVDGGTTWKRIWSRRGTYVRAIEFADDRVGFLGNVGPGYFPNVADKQPLYVTFDGGKRWTPVRPLSGKQITGVCAIDILKVGDKVAAIRAGGRVGGPAGMLESFDGGRTFAARDMSGFTGMILDIRFIDEQVGFIAGASEGDEDRAHAKILKTVDGGKTWRTVFESNRAGDNNWKLAFPSANVGYGTIISYQAPDGEARGYVVKTEDGGERWQRQTVTLDPQWVPYGINFLDERHGWVGGSTGGFETKDGGLTWVPASMGLSVNKIRFVKQTSGTTSAFAIGKDLYRLDIVAR